MGPSFFQPPAADGYALRRVRVPRCLVKGEVAWVPTGDGDLVALDLRIAHGRIDAIAPAGSLPPESGPDMRGAIVLPGLLDVHTHLDKGHIWPRQSNPTGDGAGATAATMRDRTMNWHADDVSARMDFALRTAYAKGVVAIRTHLDSQSPQAGISFPVFRAMRDRWAGRIDLQVSSIAPLDIFLREEGWQLADTVAESGGHLGCVTRSSRYPGDPMPPDLDAGLMQLFHLAKERGLDVDLHVDEATDARARSLVRVARVALQQDFPHRILCGHCTALALQTDAFIDETITACKDAGVAIVSLPTVNMYLQDRSESATRTPRWRGVTVLHEMKARGLEVAVAGDNCRDPFHAYGDHDMLETYTQAVKILQLDHPFDDWLRSVSATPAAIMQLPERGTIRAGVPADLIVLRARSYSEMLSRHQYDRTVLRGGRAIDTTLPDYSELDAFVGFA